MRTASLLVATTLLLALPGCGAGIDRQTTLDHIARAMNEEIPQDDPTVLEDHNQVVENARDGNVFDGMRRHEVEAAIGRGQECGARELCTRHDLDANDWVYEVGQRDGVSWGPTLIIGFDRQGIVDSVYTLVRH